MPEDGMGSDLPNAVQRFRVVCRAPATVLFRPGDSFEVPYKFDSVPITLTFRTRYLDRSMSSPVPGDLWMDAEGPAADLRSAVSIFTNGGRLIGAMMALCANASLRELEPEVAYETTLGVERRQFMQRYVPPDRYNFTSRYFDPDSLSEVITLIAQHQDRDRITRAIASYAEALGHWRSGSELMALSHLFIAAEALKTAAWRTEARRQGIDREALAAQWGFNPNGRMSIAPFVDQEARLRLVFANDQACLTKARATSDAYEHGLSNLPTLYQPASDCLMQTAAYLRAAIFTMVGVSEATFARLTSQPFDEPRGPGDIESYIWGDLVGTESNLAASGFAYPQLDWPSNLKDVSFDEGTQKHGFVPAFDGVARFAEGVVLTAIRVEVFDRSSFTPFVPPKSPPGVV